MDIREELEMGSVLSIHVSAERGIIKTDVPEVIVLEGWGLEGDAHGGEWDRQVSIFPIEALDKVPQEKKQKFLPTGIQKTSRSQVWH